MKEKSRSFPVCAMDTHKLRWHLSLGTCGHLSRKGLFSPHSGSFCCLFPLRVRVQSSRRMTFSPTPAPGTRQLLLTCFLGVPVCTNIMYLLYIKCRLDKCQYTRSITIIFNFGHYSRRTIHQLMQIVTASVTGAASHTPVMPNHAGSTKIQASSTTSPRDMEITADSSALPIDVK